MEDLEDGAARTGGVVEVLVGVGWVGEFLEFGLVGFVAGEVGAGAEEGAPRDGGDVEVVGEEVAEGGAATDGEVEVDEGGRVRGRGGVSGAFDDGEGLVGDGGPVLKGDEGVDIGGEVLGEEGQDVAGLVADVAFHLKREVAHILEVVVGCEAEVLLERQDSVARDVDDGRWGWGLIRDEVGWIEDLFEARVIGAFVHVWRCSVLCWSIGIDLRFRDLENILWWQKLFVWNRLYPLRKRIVLQKLLLKPQRPRYKRAVRPVACQKRVVPKLEAVMEVEVIR